MKNVFSSAGMLWFRRPGEVSNTMVPLTKSQQKFSIGFWIIAENSSATKFFFIKNINN